MRGCASSLKNIDRRLVLQEWKRETYFARQTSRVRCAMGRSVEIAPRQRFLPEIACSKRRYHGTDLGENVT